MKSIASLAVAIVASARAARPCTTHPFTQDHRHDHRR